MCGRENAGCFRFDGMQLVILPLQGHDTAASHAGHYIRLLFAYRYPVARQGVDRVKQQQSRSPSVGWF